MGVNIITRKWTIDQVFIHNPESNGLAAKENVSQENQNFSEAKVDSLKLHF
jgi:hypothetical protein